MQFGCANVQAFYKKEWFPRLALCNTKPVWGDSLILCKRACMATIKEGRCKIISFCLVIEILAAGAQLESWFLKSRHL